MCGEIRLIISLLDSRYDEKYSRWRSLFFYRSRMTALRQPTPYAVILAKAGIQYNMCGDSRLIISLLDSRYDEKYGRWRSLFFYRSRMTALR